MGDICKINGAEIEPVWCITGGSPCQDLSIAGKRAGLAGARSGLFMEQVRIVKEMREADKRNGRTCDMVRPRYLVWENVVGAFSSNKGKDFAAVLEEIIKIVEPEAPGIEVPEKGWPTWGGYHDEMGGRWSVVWRTHDAQYWGVPQRRRRISVVADFGGDTASEIQFDGESLPGDIAESGASGEGSAEAAESGFNPAVARSLTARADGSPCADRGHNIVCSPHQGGCDGGGKGALVQTEKSGTLGTGNNQLVVCAGFKLGNSEQARSIGYQEELSPTLNAECGGNKPAVVAPAAMAFDTTQITSKENGSQPEFGKPCHTLNANAHVPCVALDMTPACDVIRECGEQVPALQARMGTGGNQVPLTYQMNGFGDYRAAEVASSCKQRDFKDSTDLAITNMVVRRLTPMECERLQGFPDHWTDIGEWTDGKGKRHKPSDSQRYKALGNSIALPFWDWMLRRMARYLPEDATLGSLFDGIAGFPLIWERIHGKGTARWASEIEPFPIAMTKKHFPEEE